MKPTAFLAVVLWAASAAAQVCHVQVVTRDCRNGRCTTSTGQGTAFCVAPDPKGRDRWYLLTAKHVVPTSTVSVRLSINGQRVPATVVARHPSLDVALLSARYARRSSDRVYVLETETRRGESVESVGYRPGEGWRRRRFTVAAGGGGVGIVATGPSPCLPGESGGPIRNARGHVVGVQSMMSPGLNGLGPGFSPRIYAVPVGRFAPWVTSLVKRNGTAVLDLSAGANLGGPNGLSIAENFVVGGNDIESRRLVPGQRYAYADPTPRIDPDPIDPGVIDADVRAPAVIRASPAARAYAGGPCCCCRGCRCWEGAGVEPRVLEPEADPVVIDAVDADGSHVNIRVFDRAGNLRSAERIDLDPVDVRLRIYGELDRLGPAGRSLRSERIILD